MLINQSVLIKCLVFSVPINISDLLEDDMNKLSLRTGIFMAIMDTKMNLERKLYCIWKWGEQNERKYEGKIKNK